MGDGDEVAYDILCESPQIAKQKTIRRKSIEKMSDLDFKSEDVETVVDCSEENEENGIRSLIIGFRFS